MRHVLDLGCGFGFLAEVLAERVAPDAQFIGVDEWSSNEKPYLDRIHSANRRGSFEIMHIDTELPWQDEQFDLVICSYSLYFFPQVLPEIARLLMPDGLFFTITHSEQSIVGDLPAGGFEREASGILSLVQQFSAENGNDILNPWFGKINKIKYENALRFEAQNIDRLIAYLSFKLPLLVPGASPGDALPNALEKYVRDLIRKQERITIEKNDCAFHCWRPRRP